MNQTTCSHASSGCDYPAGECMGLCDSTLHPVMQKALAPFAPPAEYVGLVDVDAIPAPTAAAWRFDPIPYYSQPRYARPSYDVKALVSPCG